jgi:hypothetical protein
MICDGEQDQARLDSTRVTKRKVTSRCSSHVDSAGSVAVALLNEKVHSAAPQIVSQVDSISDVVVEADAPQSATRAFVQRGLRIHKADAAVSDYRGQITEIRTNKQ